MNYALLKGHRDKIAEILDIPLCGVCNARHPAINEAQPLLVPADDRAEAIRRTKAHILDELSRDGEMTVKEVARRLGIV